VANFISKSITIKWGGSDHKIAVTNELCNHLESNGINLFKMQMDLNSGQTPKFFLLGNLIAQLLNYAGILVSQEDVMNKLTKEPADSVEFFHFALAFMSMVFPAVDDAPMGKPAPEAAQN
tara:strand:- start:185 stop:544 length:360 start_codon:yes stop_codon:yes gene_type:complete